MSLLDMFTGPQGISGGLLSALQAIPQAVEGSAAQPPPLDPMTASMVDPATQAWAAQNYQRNMSAQIAHMAASGAKPYQLGPEAGQAAGAQYTSDIHNAIGQAMMIRAMSGMQGQGPGMPQQPAPGAPGPQQAPGGPPMPGSSGPPQAAPGASQGQPQAQPRQPQPSDIFEPGLYGAPTQIPRLSMDPMAAAFVPPEFMKRMTDMHGLQMEDYNAQMKQAQLRAAGVLNALKTAADSPRAASLILASPMLQAEWAKTAPMFQIDPNSLSDPRTPAQTNEGNARQVLSYMHDRLASGLQLPTIGQPELYANVAHGVGGSSNVNLKNGQVTPGASELAGDAYMTPNPAGGAPIVSRMTNAQAMARGAVPFNADQYGAQALLSDPKAIDTQYGLWKAAGGVLPTGLARNQILAPAMLSEFGRRAAAEGNSPLAIVAQGQATEAMAKTTNSFKSGADADQIEHLNTAILHSQAAVPLLKAMGTGSSPLINEARLEWQHQTGMPAPASYEAITNLLGGEIASAIGYDSQAERERLVAPLNKANGAPAIIGALNTFSGALASKTVAKKNKWDVSTQGLQGPFDQFLLPSTKAALAGHGGAVAAPQGAPTDISDIMNLYPPKK